MKISVLRHPGWYLWPLPALLAFLAQRFLAGAPEISERWHSQGLFRWLSTPISKLTSQVPFSFAEMLVILGCPLLLVLFVIWLVKTIRRPGKKARIGRLACGLAWILSLGYLGFMLLHGLNYTRLPVAQSFALPARDRNTAEVLDTAVWLADQASLLRKYCYEDTQGVFRLDLDIDRTLQNASAGYQAAAAEYPLLEGPQILPKRVLLSHYWSYTGITGLYFPHLVESNVNIDVPSFQLPGIALHEIAHTRGFAREDEAGFIAFLAGLAHPSPDYAYSILTDAALRCLNVLYTQDEQGYQTAAGHFSEAVWRDLAAGSAYWKQFEGPIQETASNVNNAYLKANLQKDGVQSYGRMIDLVLAWHEAKQQSGTLNRTVAALQDKAGR